MCYKPRLPREPSRMRCHGAGPRASWRVTVAMSSRAPTAPVSSCRSVAAHAPARDRRDRAFGDGVQSSSPVVIENCGVSTTYARPPARAVTLNQAATEVMLALGLQDRLVGTAYLDDQMLPEFAAAYRRIPVLAAKYPSREVLLAARPDFLYAAYPGAFGADGIGSRTDWKSRRVDTYLAPAGCADKSRPPGVSLETTFAELRDVARIFGVTPRAETARSPHIAPSSKPCAIGSVTVSQAAGRVLVRRGRSAAGRRVLRRAQRDPAARRRDEHLCGHAWIVDLRQLGGRHREEPGRDRPRQRVVVNRRGEAPTAVREEGARRRRGDQAATDRRDRFRLHDAGDQERRRRSEARRSALSRTVPMTAPSHGDAAGGAAEDAAAHRACWSRSCSPRVTVAVMIGPVSIHPGVVWRVALDNLVPGWLSPTWQPFEASIVWDVRLPRVLLATIVGAGLAVVGRRAAGAAAKSARRPIPARHLGRRGAGRGRRAALRNVGARRPVTSRGGVCRSAAGDDRPSTRWPGSPGDFLPRAWCSVAWPCRTCSRR